MDTSQPTEPVVPEPEKVLEAPVEAQEATTRPVGHQTNNQLPKGGKRKQVREWRWWKSDPLKLTKLEQAFAIGCTDKEACGYADLTEKQLYYYEKMFPDFGSRKQVLKDKVILKARQTVANEVDKSYANAMDLLKRKRKAEFGDNVDITTDGEKLPATPANNEIVFVSFGTDDHAEGK
jgi:hypothetical protein